MLESPGKLENFWMSRMHPKSLNQTPWSWSQAMIDAKDLLGIPACNEVEEPREKNMPGISSLVD